LYSFKPSLCLPYIILFFRSPVFYTKQMLRKCFHCPLSHLFSQSRIQGYFAEGHFLQDAQDWLTLAVRSLQIAFPPPKAQKSKGGPCSKWTIPQKWSPLLETLALSSTGAACWPKGLLPMGNVSMCGAWLCTPRKSLQTPSFCNNSPGKKILMYRELRKCPLCRKS
jgi:hypothetical protein